MLFNHSIVTKLTVFAVVESSEKLFFLTSSFFHCAVFEIEIVFGSQQTFSDGIQSSHVAIQLLYENDALVIAAKSLPTKRKK